MSKKVAVLLLCLAATACSGTGSNGLSSTVTPQVDQVRIVDGDYQPPPKGARTSKDRAAIFMQAANLATRAYNPSSSAGDMDAAKQPWIRSERLPSMRAVPTTHVAAIPLPPSRPGRTDEVSAVPETKRTIPASSPQPPRNAPAMSMPETAKSQGI